MSEGIERIGIKKRRVIVELKDLQKVVKKLKVQKGLSQDSISKHIEFRIADVLNHRYSIPYESFKKLEILSEGTNVTLRVRKTKYRKGYNKHSMEQLTLVVGMKKTGVAGKFLSKKYMGLSVSSKWQCGKCGRIWNTSPSAIMYRGGWCIRCSGREAWTYRQMVEFAKKRGLEKTGVKGKFLTKEADFESRSHPDMSKYHWECGKCGHVWEATANN
ncbi:hypothetical protein LCGC14_2187340, partial [marine sediment metagenome]